jgi:hypothetical protein
MTLNTLNILIVVDVQGALASSSLMNNVYMVDTNKYLGSWQEGTNQLHTVCQDGQLLNWRAVSISPDNEINITGFSGQMVSTKICNPVQQGLAGETYWTGRVETQGAFSSYDYTLTLSIDGKKLSFSPFVKVV